ncbi:hypothetical protein COC60_17820 [Bacillus thuringiensis]|uniref:DUF2651 domain-containing protein n=4 Tax=Bacillus cereus group TaxID=86661 RepID=A0AB35PIQ1_BACTU|nr:hypothetical protein BTF1_03540 [Bacillus thuringiensis HD-789]AJH04131.1 putative membrane protein [Bacillus thuringiensis HD1002]AXR15724.1 hypothetical protein DOS87_06295 [Bacillus sp. CR71]AXR21458.1 hypothetical protein DPQ26_06285 [Bacillus sp. E25]AZV65167.1 hypothetical protein DT426_05665 [Bacillus cereus]EJR03527.1 hypothetical protein II5_03858 [Bacillus cereus MSX-A1]KAA0786351.1 hypothetical protein DN406_25595 [Bacillus sp. BB56-3]KAA8486219.1 hypothetical protein FYW98_193
MIGIYNVVFIVALLVIMLKRKNYRATMVLVVSLIYTILVSFTSYMSFLGYTINVIIVIFLGSSFILAGIFEKEK